ncbi:MAG: hypothetical protein WEE64_14085 [Dehalococcoidia bacterium]
MPGSPAHAGEFGFSVPDPEGDTFGSPPPAAPDITNVAGTIDSTTFTLSVQFADDVSPPDSGAPDAISGFVVFDTDQDASTGVYVDTEIAQFCPQPLAIGSDVTLQLFNYQGGGAPMIRTPGGQLIVQAVITFDGPSFTAVMPLSALGDDDFNFAVLVAPPDIPITDCAPGDGGTIDTTAFQTAPTATATERPPPSPTDTPAPTATTAPSGLPVLGGGEPRESAAPVWLATGLGALALLTFAGARLRARR